MTETVVHVTTIEEWKSVLDVWFEQGFSWWLSGTAHNEKYFRKGERYLMLDQDNDILTTSNLDRKIIGYSEFMAQQKEDNNMETYYVTKEQLDLIESAKGLNYPLTGITAPENLQKEFDKTHFDNEKEILRYLGGDKTIEFKVKEPLYRLWRVDEGDSKVYMNFLYGTPDWTPLRYDAFTATLEEIKKWKTPAWDIEKAD